MLLLTVPVVGLVARFERPAPDPRPAPVAWRPLVAVVAVCGGLGLLAKNGMIDTDGVNVLAAALPFVGMFAGGAIRNPLAKALKLGSPGVRPRAS